MACTGSSLLASSAKSCSQIIMRAAGPTGSSWWILLFYAALTATGETKACDETAMETTQTLSQLRTVLQKQKGDCPESQLTAIYKRRSKELLGTELQPDYAVVDRTDCWNAQSTHSVTELWETCCSKQTTVSRSNSFLSKDSLCIKNRLPMCCAISQDNKIYLLLPMVQETSITVRLNQTFYPILQEGWLRPHRPAGILWPSGYLLAVCFSNPNVCGVPHLRGRVLELGAGTGLPSIVGAKTFSLATFVATDKEDYAVQLVTANAKAVGVSDRVVAHQLDHFDAESVTAFRERYGRFPFIMGSALQSLFADTTDATRSDHNHDYLWELLDKLLEKSEHAVVLLSHTSDGLRIPEDCVLDHWLTIPGHIFGWRTRQGEPSDFELSVLTRKHVHTEL